MATRGFEFAYMLDGSERTPYIRDMILSAAAAHKAGDLMVIETDGDLTQAAANATEVTGVIQETIAAADITAGTTKGKVAILARDQVWRCSSDDTSITGVVGYTKACDIVDCNTFDASATTGGKMALVNKSSTDAAGNAIAYVVFTDTTFGNT
jgi:hypothetical protein